MDLNEVNPKYNHSSDLTFMGGVQFRLWELYRKRTKYLHNSIAKPNKLWKHLESRT